MTVHKTIEADAPEAQSETMTGAEMVVRALLDQGVDTVFGYPGGAVLPIYDAIFHLEAKNQARRRCATSWSATNRAPPTPRRAMPAPPASPAWCWSPPARARPTRSPASSTR